MSLTDEQKNECKQAFAFYSNGGKIGFDDFLEAMKCVGVCFGVLEKKELEKQSDFGLEDVEKYFTEKMVNQNTKEDILNTLKTFDPMGNGSISADELRHTMCCLGDRLTKDEANDLFPKIDPQNTGEINFETMAEFLAK